MIINGVEIQDIDVFDINTAEVIEKSYKKAMDKVQNIKGGLDVAYMKNVCIVVYDVFDELVGKETREKIFGDKMNMMVCINSLSQLVDAVNSQKTQLNGIMNKYSPNRATRRKGK